jgi:hypothetical protein
MPILDKRKISKIIIEASNGSNSGFVKLQLKEPISTKRVSSTWYPKLFSDQRFSKKGDTVLEFYRLLKPDPFNNLYSLRGYVAEKMVEEMLVKKGYKVETQIKDQDNSNNPVFKYFNGVPDIIYTDNDGKRHVLEIKSKSMSKMQFVKDSPPETEIMQGKMLGFIFGFDEINMLYFFFSDEIETQMQNIVESISNYNNDEAYEKFLSKQIKMVIKKDFDIVSVKYDIDKKKLLDEMKKSYKYAEGFRQTLQLSIQDLSQDVFGQLFKLNLEIENGYEPKHN